MISLQSSQLFYNKWLKDSLPIVCKSQYTKKQKKFAKLLFKFADFFVRGYQLTGIFEAGNLNFQAQLPVNLSMKHVRLCLIKSLLFNHTAGAIVAQEVGRVVQCNTSRETAGRLPYDLSGLDPLPVYCIWVETMSSWSCSVKWASPASQLAGIKQDHLPPPLTVTSCQITDVANPASPCFCLPPCRRIQAAAAAAAASSIFGSLNSWWRVPVSVLHSFLGAMLLGDCWLMVCSPPPPWPSPRLIIA